MVAEIVLALVVSSHHVETVAWVCGESHRLLFSHRGVDGERSNREMHSLEYERPISFQDFREINGPIP